MGIPGFRFGVVVVLLVLEAAALGMVACSSATTTKALHLSSACTNSRAVALTFDDGPNPPYSGQILSILKSHNVKATFFAEGRATDAHPEVVRDEVAAGMAMGNHSWSHSDKLPSASPDEFALDTSIAGQAIERAAGYAPALYRSPYGHTSDSMLRGLRKLGYVSVGWDIDSKDWTDASVDEIVQNVLVAAHPGAIVLMHDGGLGGGDPDRTKTIEALPRLIDGLTRAGYTFATLPEATGASMQQSSSQVGALRCSAS